MPNIYIDITPRHSGELIPNFSVINARLGSRPIECVMPIDSLLKPNKTANGKEIKIVPRFPISCKISAGPAEIIFGKAGPASTPNLAINSATDMKTKGSEFLACFRFTSGVKYAIKPSKTA